MDDVRRTTGGRRLDGYTISSPCDPNGSGELNIKACLNMRKNTITCSVDEKEEIENSRHMCGIKRQRTRKKQRTHGRNSKRDRR